MKSQLFFTILFFLSASFAFAQHDLYPYLATASDPFGLPNPEAPPELLDWADLIGECDCRSVARNTDGTWGDTISMIWRFKYIMNGFGVQDETFKADGKHSGSIRQFIPDSSRWFVHYYSSGSPSGVLPAWEGTKKEDGNIILYRDQKAPNGMEGNYKITFYNISPSGFDWLGEWVDKAETFSYPTWNIFCKKRSGNTHKQDSTALYENIALFSKAVVAGDAAAIAKMYTTDGKIFPGGMDIIEGHEGLEKYWKPGENAQVTYHEIKPEELKFLGDYAYDYGYYRGTTTRADDTTSDWAGKYVIVWKRVEGEWKIYLDIWNRM